MMWVLMCFIAIVIALLLYSKIEDQLPEALHLPKTSRNGSLVVTDTRNSAAVGGLVVPGATWQVRGDGKNVELVRDFDGSLEVNGQRYDAPTLVVTCFDGELFAHVDLRMAVQSDGKYGKVRTPAGDQQWRLGQGHDLYSPTPKAMLAAVQADKPFQLRLPYAELGVQTVTFTPKGGRSALAALPTSCRN